jgi:hypothetical protein
MHTDIVAESPKVGMEFMYHRRDGLWLFKVDSMDSDYITYKYKYYKGRKARARVDLQELLDYCDGKPWERGSMNTYERWKKFITRGSEGQDFAVMRIEIVKHLTNPTWVL